MFQGELPSRVVIGFVSAGAYSGDYKMNPFNFKHYNIEFLCVYANGQSVPSKALQPKFDTNNYIEAYHTLFSGMGIEMGDAGVYCTREDYGQGYTLVVFDLTSHVYMADQQPLHKKGNLSLEARFAKALPEAINVLVYAAFPSQLQVDQTRAILL